MCGIVGIVGSKNASDFLISGLKRLEYRGYDSAGIALLNNNLNIIKEKGKIANLETSVNALNIQSSIGIGHTRWATHGIPSKENAHPHTDGKNNFAVTHNGIIENYIELKEMLKEKGYSFYSQTDTEVIPKLLEYFYKGSVVEAIKETVNIIRGSFALLILSTFDPDTIFAVRKESPMIIGLGKNENYIASDITPLIDSTRKVIIMNDEQIAVIKKENLDLFDFNLNPVKEEITEINWDIGTAEKDGHPHFMIKEIQEQPQVIKNVLKHCNNKSDKIEIKELDISNEYIKEIEKIIIIACGTAYNSGLVAKPFFERFANIPVNVELASEFRYTNPLIQKNTLAIFVSQSGETADTLAALKLAKEKGVKTIAISNVVGSSITREADHTLYIHAGTEISVASTKAYTGQVMTLLLLMAHISEIKKPENSSELRNLYNDMHDLSSNLSDIINRKDEIKDISQKLIDKEHAFYIGRGFDYAAAIEGVLKLKEISYIHAECFAAGELKHGPIALIEENTPVVAICTQKDLLEKVISNILEVKARGATIISFGLKEFSELERISDYTFLFNTDNELLSPIPTAAVLQLLAYYTAQARGCDIDQPRNLAKSVTVE